MALKHVKALATMQDVATYNYRSTNEVVECAVQIGTEGRASVTALRYAGKTLVTASDLRVDLLRKNYDIANDLQQRIDMLDSLLMQLKYHFAGTPGQQDAITSVRGIRTQLDTKLDQAYSYLSDLAIKLAPEGFALKVKEVVVKVMNGLKNPPLLSQHQLVSLMPQTDDLVFTTYVKMENFKDDSGHVHPEYYLVFTGHYEEVEGETDLYVTSLNSFVVPGRFKWGTQFVDQDGGVQACSDLLDADNFGDLGRRLPVPVKRVTTQELQQSRRWVADVVVEDNQIKVKLAVGVGREKVAQVVEKLTADIAGVLSKFTTGRLRFKTRWAGRQYRITYTLVHPEFTPHRMITVQQLDGLKGLGFDDLDIARLQQALTR